MKARYLTFFSYIGTSFRSSEKIWLRAGRNYPDPQSVQGVIELGLLRLRSINYPNVTLSSRTDGGVHALISSAHFDLDRYGTTRLYEPHDIVFTLNKFFYKSGTSITIRKCQLVNDNFNARYNAVKRTYLYRLAVLKKDVIVPELTGIASKIPIEELNRCHFIRHSEFDIDRFIAGSKYLLGYHDFTTFKKFDKEKQHKHNRREIYGIEVRPGRPQVTSCTGDDSFFHYWDIEIKGRAFVHNQIRRMIGTLISVAIGRIEVEVVKEMLQIPSKHSWRNCIPCSPPDGLYLANVEYNPEDLIYEPKEQLERETNREDSECDSDSE